MLPTLSEDVHSEDPKNGTVGCLNLFKLYERDHRVHLLALPGGASTRSIGGTIMIVGETTHIRRERSI